MLITVNLCTLYNAEDTITWPLVTIFKPQPCLIFKFCKSQRARNCSSFTCAKKLPPGALLQSQNQVCHLLQQFFHQRRMSLSCLRRSSNGLLRAMPKTANQRQGRRKELQFDINLSRPPASADISQWETAPSQAWHLGAAHEFTIAAGFQPSLY